MADLPIPTKAVEAAARAAHDHWRHECAAQDQEDVSFWLDWEALEEVDREGWRKQTRAAICAALGSWPGVEQNFSWDGSRSRIVLPLPQEACDEK